MSVIRDTFGDVTPKTGRITLELPPLAESGNSVPLKVSIDSPMTEADHVRRVCIFANRNPRPLIATVIFTPQAGKAAFSTTMRLSDTQDVIAIAEFSDRTGAILLEALAVSWVSPRLGDNPGAIPWDPFFFRRVCHCFDERLGLQPVLFEYLLDGGDATLDRSDLLRRTGMTNVHD